MGRPKVPQRKKQLLDEILIYLKDKSLSSISFRTLADGLGVSTYVLVYQFGNREDLLQDIVREVNHRSNSVELPEHFQGDWSDARQLIQGYLYRSNHEEMHHLVRLEFEAALLESTGSLGLQDSINIMHLWEQVFTHYFSSLGVSQERADFLSGVWIDGFTGLIYNSLLKRQHRSEAQIAGVLDIFEISLRKALEEGGVDADAALKQVVSFPLGVIAYTEQARG